jgi:hypothetical protein
MATFVVTNTKDSGNGSLRAAIEAADITQKADTIVFSQKIAGQTIVLASRLDIGTSVTIDGDINGDNRADVTISGGNQTRVIDIENRFLGDAPEVSLLSLTITNGNSDEGAGIYMRSSGTLDIVDTTVSNCSADYGAGGLYIGSGANGPTKVKVVNSLFTGNTAGAYGGAIRNNGNLTVINTTITGNTSVTGGSAGILNESGSLVLVNSTVVENHAQATGVAAGIAAGDSLTIINSVVADNTSGTANVESDVAGDIDSATGSVFGTDVTIITGTGNQENVGDVGLGTLLDNGGTVLTMSPLDGSLLIDGGSNGAIAHDLFDFDGDGNTAEDMPIDARALARVAGSGVDVGAVEYVVDELIIGTAGSDLILGGLGLDFLIGLKGDDVIKGGAAEDIVEGGLGDDILIGGAGDDQVNGGRGGDSLTGGNGADFLAGGSGGDIFTYLSVADTGTAAGLRDVITDFTHGSDLLDFSAIDGDGAGTSDSFSFIGNQAFHGIAGELRQRIVGGNCFIEGDVDGDGSADLAIFLVDTRGISFDNNDFIL